VCGKPFEVHVVSNKFHLNRLSKVEARDRDAALG